ncbi:hypothetical protein CD932_18630 [Janthinobacterium sp. PC23-8]|nr:TetR/AcrR family transcriptional regulator [Janthinobacterium sp. PC23-8]OYO29367.1 hypothetical protein CD932_18630 [Janthinobacterium sp. PC23-8]
MPLASLATRGTAALGVLARPIRTRHCSRSRSCICSNTPVPIAEEFFLEKGAGVPLEGVAKRADVGIGTLYRRFPTREAPLAATGNERFLSLAETSRSRDPALTPGEALRAYLEELARNTSTHPSLAASIGTVVQYGKPGCNAITAKGIGRTQAGQRPITHVDIAQCKRQQKCPSFAARSWLASA